MNLLERLDENRVDGFRGSKLSASQSTSAMSYKALVNCPTGCIGMY